MKTFLGKLLLSFISLLPLSFARACGGLLANILSLVDNDLYKVTEENLKLVKPELNQAELKTLTRDSVKSTLINALEMPIAWQRNEAWLDKVISNIINEHLMNDAIEKNKGVLLLCPHVGNWEVLGRYLPRFAPTTSLYQPPKYEFLEDLVKKGREKSGANLVPTSQRGIAQLLKSLRNGGITGILPDQVPKNDSGIFVPFFGIDAFTMTLVHSLVQKTGCTAILGYTLRVKDGFTIIFKEVPKEIYSSDAKTSVTALSKTVEMSLEEEFSQYQWAYKRFKFKPDGSRRY